jgi:ABC-type Zn uptake system ZnuABC Zn-binding protein ZnuA
MRIWQAYLNEMYEKSFKILISEQEQLYKKNFGKFCAELKKLAQEKSEMYKKF